jgi:hypothetical protein
MALAMVAQWPPNAAKLAFNAITTSAGLPFNAIQAMNDGYAWKPANGWYARNASSSRPVAAANAASLPKAIPSPCASPAKNSRAPRSSERAAN